MHKIIDFIFCTIKSVLNASHFGQVYDPTGEFWQYY